VTAVDGRYFDGRTSASRPAVVDLRRDAAGAAWLVIATGTGCSEHLIESCTLDMAVGRGFRRIDLPDGGSVELADGVAWDALLDRYGLQRAERTLARTESRWLAALLALLLAGVGLWSASTYGVPALVAHALPVIPAELDARVGQGGLELLDQELFDPSGLEPRRCDELRRKFLGVARDLRLQGRVRLEFRRSDEVGANAFALPDGIVIATDELVALARHDDELRAVFAHELSHVRHRHAMRVLLSSSLQALLTVVVLGDVSAATTLVAGVPATLAHSAYSRDLEREADATARAWLAQAGVAQTRYNDLLRRLEAASVGGRWTYLSTHPPLAERLGDATPPAAR
jgi:Zn-dependent protease with chaperone function